MKELVGYFLFSFWTQLYDIERSILYKLFISLVILWISKWWPFFVLEWEEEEIFSIFFFLPFLGGDFLLYGGFLFLPIKSFESLFETVQNYI